MSNILTGNIDNAVVVTLVVNPASVAASTTVEQTYTLPGVKVGDFVFANKPTATVGVGIGGVRVTAADTIGITWVNATVAAVDPASETYTFFVVRPELARTSAYM